MCKYCEGDIWDRETIESNNRIEYTVGDKELLIASWTPAFDGYNAECNWESEIPINYCPMCRKEAGRVKHITLKEMLEEIIQCILEQKEIKDYYWKDGEEEFRRITEIDLLDRIRTSNDDFTEFEWELAESRLYKVE